MKERLGRYYLSETALFYSGFELDKKKKKRKTAWFLEQIIERFFSLFSERIFNYIVQPIYSNLTKVFDQELRF